MKLIAFLIIVASVIGIVTIKDYADVIAARGGLDVACPNIPSKAETHADAIKKAGKKNLLTCYCLPIFQKNFFDAFNMRWNEFELDGLPDDNLYC